MRHPKKKPSHKKSRISRIASPLANLVEDILFEAINSAPGYGKTPSYRQSIKIAKAQKGRK